MLPRQLEDDGAVIGYRPHLEYNKNTSNQPKITNMQPESVQTDYSGVKYSNALMDFGSSCPSMALSTLDNTIKNIEKAIQRLSGMFSSDSHDDYSDISSLLSAIMVGNSEFADDFINHHFIDISQSQIPEIIGELNAVKDRINTLEKTYKELFYGDESIKTEQAEKIDNAALNQMQTYESVGTPEKINYVSVAFDNLLGRSTVMYGISINKCVACLRNIFSNHDINNLNPERMAAIKKLFDEVNDEISYRKKSYDNKQSVEIMQKTLYNYYEKRSELLTLYDLFSESKESFMIGKRIQKKQKELDEAVEEVNRSYLGNKFHLDEITNLEQEKQYLREIYAGFNYNS